MLISTSPCFPFETSFYFLSAQKPCGNQLCNSITPWEEQPLLVKKLLPNICIGKFISPSRDLLKSLLYRKQTIHYSQFTSSSC